MLRFYEMMYYAIHRRTLEDGSKSNPIASRLYFILLFLNASTCLILMNQILASLGIHFQNGFIYCFALSAVIGFCLELMIERREAEILGRFKDKEWSNIATWLLGYIVFSLAAFAVITWRFQ